MAFTHADIDNSNSFSEANNKIRLINALYRKAPHLASHLKIDIRDATDADFYIPATLKHASKVVNIEITKTLCDMLSCNPSKEKGMCNENDKATYYYVGDDGWDIQCQPACFNTIETKVYNEQGQRKTNTPMLNYHNGKCRLVNSPIVTYLEKPFFRSTVKYETRLNDMPTGFSRRPPVAENEYGCGLDYRTNKTYCQYYDRHLMSDGSCSMTKWEKVLDSVIGMSLINSIKSSIRVVSNQHVPFELPEHLPPLPTQIPDMYTLDGWKNNIDKSFIVPPLIDTRPKQHNNTGSRSKRSTADNTNQHDRRRSTENELLDFETMSPFMKKQYNIPHTTDQGGGGGGGRIKRAAIPGGAITSTSVDRFKEVFLEMLHILTTDPKFWLMLGMNIATDWSIDYIKTLCARLIEQMTKYVSVKMIDMSAMVGSRVLAACLRSLSVKLVTGTVARIGSKSAIMLAKIASAATSVVGWFLISAMIFDMILTVWDPFGYKNLFPATFPSDMMANGELALRQAFGKATTDYEFDMFVDTVLSQEEIIMLQVDSMIDRLIYLDALIVNSNGTRLDKGQLVYLGQSSAQQMKIAANAAMAKRVQFNPRTYQQYNQAFLDRMRISKALNYVSMGSAVVGIVVWLVFHLNTLGILLAIIAICLFALNRYTLENDLLVDLFRQLRIFRDDSKFNLQARSH
ncbi:uncharacterized protein LOC120355442 [Nilaparvata lugens]|uniref:p74 n=1 Tax=Nilaparvata lugens endogenous nudivirus TaxID=1487700 RepID=X5GF23_9VIRU|nr:uncharacterized protein LOC120355442 [Nilaparvata lugens]AHW98274.1 P74 [Nilaparvata lugens endogenous nudivirus]